MMHAHLNKFLFWLLELNTLMRYFVIAILLHALVLFVLGSVKIVHIIRQMPVIELPQFIEESPKNDTPQPPVGGTGKTGGTGPSGIHAGADRSIIKPPSISIDKLLPPEGWPTSVVGVPTDAPGGRPLIDGPAGNPPFSGLDPSKIFSPGEGGLGGSHFRHRPVSPDQIAKVLKEYDGPSQGDKAVLAALRWLKANQQPDGSWKGNTHTAAVSAFAVLAYLGHGDTPDTEEFGQTISKALVYLIGTINREGVVQPPNMYAQGAVLLALSEAYGMTGSALVKGPLERMIATVVRAQKVAKLKTEHVGGWRYSLEANDADVSVSGWLIMGLKSARMAGLSVPDETLTLASKYLWNNYSATGEFGYSSPTVAPHTTANTTAVGVLCQQFLGHYDDKRVKKALDTIKTFKFDWNESKGGFVLYGWYYMTQAMFHAGGSHWQYWNKQFCEKLIKVQAEDGHWDSPPKSNEAQFGPVYSTTLSCLMLEVYYRHLPIYQEMEQKSLPGNFGQTVSGLAPSAVMNR